MVYKTDRRHGLQRSGTLDERFWIGGGELERRRCITDSRSALADALASTLNAETEADARLVKELLRLSGT